MKMLLLAILSVSALCGVIADERAAEVLVAAGSAVYRMNLDGTNKRVIAYAINATGLDYHHSKGLLFWCDVAAHKIYSKDLFDETSEVKTIAAGASHWEPRAIAVDYVHDKIYVMDQGNRHIDVFELDGSKAINGIARNLVHPDLAESANTYDIVVDPNEGLVFFGNGSEVMRATLDFSSVVSIGKKSFVSGLAIDRDRNTIYFSNSNRFVVEMTYGAYVYRYVNVYDHASDGFRGTPLTAKSLAKYKGEFYWIDKWDDEFPGINKLDGYYPKPVDTGVKGAWTVRVRHQMLQKIKDTAPQKCKNVECPKIGLQCLESNPKYSNVEYSCLNPCGERFS